MSGSVNVADPAATSLALTCVSAMPPVIVSTLLTDESMTSQATISSGLVLVAQIDRATRIIHTLVQNALEEALSDPILEGTSRADQPTVNPAPNIVEGIGQGPSPILAPPILKCMEYK